MLAFFSLSSYSLIKLYYLNNLLLLFPLEMLVVSLLHVLDSLSKSRIPVVFDGVVSPSNQFFGDQAPLFVLLVP